MAKTTSLKNCRSAKHPLWRSLAVVLLGICLLLSPLPVHAAEGDIHTVAGGLGDGGAAILTNLQNPTGVAVDGAGNIFVADSGNHRIRKVDAATGTITTVAGNGLPGYSGDGAAAVAASLSSPTNVAVDGAGNLFIADRNNHRIRKVDAATGTISTVAGNGSIVFDGDGGPAIGSSLNHPWGVAVDNAGNLFIADTHNHRIRRVDATTGFISTVAGNGSIGFGGDGGPATSTTLYSPYNVVLDGVGNLFIADTNNHRIRKVDATTGFISTVAGNGSLGFSGDGGAATSARLNTPYSVAVDGVGNLYIADRKNQRIRKVDATTGTIATVAGNGATGYSGDGGPATGARLTFPYAVVVDNAGNLVIADSGNNRIRNVSVATGIISTEAGNGFSGFSGDGGPATRASLAFPWGVTVDDAGNLFIADTSNHRIRKVDAATGTISTVAGNGTAGFGGDGGPASNASLFYPRGIAVDGAGNLFIADSYNHRIRMVDTTGTISTVAGDGSGGFGGDGGPATLTSLFSPTSVAVDDTGNLYIADTNNSRIRKVDATTGTITTVAGNGSKGFGFGSDGGPATLTSLFDPTGVAIDGAGNLFIADLLNERIRKVAPDGTISTVAGNGLRGYGGDGGAATSARLKDPYGVAVDAVGNIIIADRSNQRIRMVDANTGTISTLAGNGSQGFSGDGGPATSAGLFYPVSVAVDGVGNVFIADQSSHRIRMVEGAQSGPTLSIASVTLNASTGSISVPVDFTPNGASVSALAFSLDYDATCLSVDETAVSGFPAGYIPSVTHDVADGELDISLFDQTSPLDPLNAGTIATIVFDVISTCPTTAVSFSTDPSISFGDTSGNAVSGTATGGTLTLEYNSDPTDITLDNVTVDENAPANTVVGTLSTVDVDAGDTHTYSLVAGTGDSGNASFTIVGSELRTAAIFDFESQGGYNIRVQTDDGHGGTFEKAFNIGVNDVNEAPTTLTLDNQTVDENLPSGTTVGTLATSGDPDTGDNHTYSLSAGETDAFAINGDSLETAESFNFEAQSSYVVTIRTTDDGDLFYEESVTITVNDLNDAPVAVDDIFDPLDLVAVGPTTLDVLANDTDEDDGALLYIQSVSSGNVAIIDLVAVDDGLEYTPPAGNGSESFTYIATESLLSSNAGIVNITYVADDLRGDCNGNGSVDAGDFSAIALEFFDTDSSINWWQIYQQGFSGSPIGCDANGSENGPDPVNAAAASVAVDDIICAVLVFFGNTACTTGGGIQSAGATTPATLAVAHAPAATGDATSVPITLDSGGHAIAAAGFTITYDAAAFAFDAGDADGDGLPDALDFQLPSGVQAWVQTDVGAIQVAVAGLSLPLPELENGTLVTVTFDVLSTGGAVSLRDASMGDTNGASVPVVVNDGTDGADSAKVFLPLLIR